MTFAFSLEVGCWVLFPLISSMKTRTTIIHATRLLTLAAILTTAQPVLAEVSLLERYPTQLTTSDYSPSSARSWEFAETDVYGLAKFKIEAGDNFKLELKECDLGVGHCADGAVWAVIIPRTQGNLSSSVSAKVECVAHVWLRFHPGQITNLFPAAEVSTNGNSALMFQIRAIANAKMRSSYQANGRALIPDPKDLTIDVDLTNSVRRFFTLDTKAAAVRYFADFENQSVKLAPAISRALAEKMFDQLWEAFDRDYAMFVLRPEVDWEKLRTEYRPRAISSKSTAELANVCAEMLRNLRDLHVWLTCVGNPVPVFDRKRAANANPAAFRSLLGELNGDRNVMWAITKDDLGFLAINAWNDSVLGGVNEALEKLRKTSRLILDVRLNGGGSETIARTVAGRFLEAEFTYGYNQIRNGPYHTNLTSRFERKVKPEGPWRYEGSVTLLIGQKCMSSSESFVAMMSGAPRVTIMGDHTCGSSGNPRIFGLPLDMTVSVPRWIDYLPDGKPIDEKGFQPSEKFEATPGAFDGTRDDLLAAALARLRK
jgi:C-terminal processing protease CtpA/Prc